MSRLAKWVLAVCGVVLTIHLVMFVWMFRYERHEGRDWTVGVVRDRLTGRYCARGYCFPSPLAASMYADNRNSAERPMLIRKYRKPR